MTNQELLKEFQETRVNNGTIKLSQDIIYDGRMDIFLIDPETEYKIKVLYLEGKEDLFDKFYGFMIFPDREELKNDDLVILQIVFDPNPFEVA